MDVIVTLILYDICTDSNKKRAIETFFRNKIKNGNFKTSLVEETLENFTSVSKP